MKNLNAAYKDYAYKKAHDMVPYTWILQHPKTFKIVDNIRDVIGKSMKNWKVELTSGGETLGEVKTNKGIFQRDSLSPILFIITLLPLSILLRDMKAGYMLGESREKLISYYG